MSTNSILNEILKYLFTNLERFQQFNVAIGFSRPSKASIESAAPNPPDDFVACGSVAASGYPMGRPLANIPCRGQLGNCET